MKEKINAIVRIISKLTWAQIFKSFVAGILFVILLLLYNMVNDQQNLKSIQKAVIEANEETEKNNKKEEVASMRARDDANPKISSELVKFLYEIGADRVMLSEFHNGQRGTGGLDFKYYDETFEEINKDRDMTYVSDQYKNMNTSKYKIIAKLRKDRIFVGSTDEIAKIDLRYSNRMTEDGMYYCGLIEVSNSETPLGVLSCFWALKDKKYIPDPDKIREALTKYAQTIAIHLTISKSNE